MSCGLLALVRRGMERPFLVRCTLPSVHEGGHASELVEHSDGAYVWLVREFIRLRQVGSVVDASGTRWRFRRIRGGGEHGPGWYRVGAAGFERHDAGLWARGPLSVAPQGTPVNGRHFTKLRRLGVRR